MEKHSKPEPFSTSFLPPKRRQSSFTVIAILAVVIICSLRFTFLYQADYIFHFTVKDAPIQATKEIPKNVAAIIENRPLDKLIPLLLHFTSVLGPAWPVVLFTSQTAIPYSASLRRAMNLGHISIKPLPLDVELKDHEEMSRFLKTAWIWKELAPAKHVLMFQADSILCSASRLTVDDFRYYNFIGTAVNSSTGHGEPYHGGLSLRNRTMMLNIISRSDPAAETAESTAEHEDQWFYRKMKELPPNVSHPHLAVLPSPEVANMFAVGPGWYETPLGYHSMGGVDRAWIRNISHWCPEYRLAQTFLE